MGKMNPVLKKNFAVFPVLDWILAITAHIPKKGKQVVRNYGYYSNASRGKRKKVAWAPLRAPQVMRPSSFESSNVGWRVVVG